MLDLDSAQKYEKFKDSPKSQSKICNVLAHRQGIYFVFPLSQEQKEQEEEEQPLQGSILQTWNLAHRHNSQN